MKKQKPWYQFEDPNAPEQVIRELRQIIVEKLTAGRGSP